MTMHDTHSELIEPLRTSSIGSGLLASGLRREDRFHPPMGFQKHRLPAIDTDSVHVFRNWNCSVGLRRAAHILVLDSDTSLMDILGQLLDGEGYNVTLAWQSLRMEDIRRLRPHVVVVDASVARDGGESRPCTMSFPPTPHSC